MIEQVLEEIQEDVSWRKLELDKVKIIASTLSDIDLKIFLKSILPLLYAHWEGFVVSSLKSVFNYLNNLNLSSNDFNDIYLTTAYEQTLKSLDDAKDFERRQKHLINLYKKFSNQVKLGTKIDTKSNLNFSILENICKKTNLNINRFTANKKELNELVNIRNSISHGENSYSFEMYADIEKYMDLLENLMLDFQSEIQDLLKEKKYLKELNE